LRGIRFDSAWTCITVNRELAQEDKEKFALDVEFECVSEHASSNIE